MPEHVAHDSAPLYTTCTYRHTHTHTHSCYASRLTGSHIPALPGEITSCFTVEICIQWLHTHCQANGHTHTHTHYSEQLSVPEKGAEFKPLLLLFALQKHVFRVTQGRAEMFTSLLFCLSSSSQSFYTSLVQTPEPYGVIFPHPSTFYPVPMQAFTQPHTPQTQLEPVDLSVSKRSSSTSSSPPCSSTSSPASPPSSPSSPYSSASRASPRSPLHSSPPHTLPPPPTTSLAYHPNMVTPLVGSGSGVMVSPVMVPLPVFYPPPLHLHQPIIVSQPVAGDNDHHPSRERKPGVWHKLPVSFIYVMNKHCLTC